MRTALLFTCEGRNKCMFVYTELHRHARKFFNNATSEPELEVTKIPFSQSVVDYHKCPFLCGFHRYSLARHKSPFVINLVL
jgi:hypothetical protein